MKRSVAAILLFFTFCITAYAAENPFELTIVSGTDRISAKAVYQADDLWVSETALKQAGVPLSDALSGKGFFLTVKDPELLFEIPALKELSGNTLKLYFPAIKIQNERYLNISGLEKIIGYKLEQYAAQPTLTTVSKETVSFNKKADSFLPKPFVMVWDNVAAYKVELSKQPVINGLDVISPAWFNLADSTGILSNKASDAYVKEAHRRNCKVWAMVSNSFNKQMTKAFLCNTSAKRQFIARLLAYSKIYGLDGINIDFENVDITDRNAFTAFAEELSKYAKAENLVFSMAVNKPANTNSAKSHDRRAFARFSDYIMVMTYDQHWRASPVAGSVADLQWTKASLIKTLEEVPSEKLLLGIPLYMRRWTCTALPNGKEKVQGETLTMAQSDELIRKYNIIPTWLEDKGQNYYEFSENGKKIKVWVEDAKSMARRGALAKEFNLAGVACWRKGHEQPYAWPALINALR